VHQAGEKTIKKSETGEYVKGWTMQGSNPGRGKKCFLSSRGLDRPLGTASAILHGHHSSFSGVKQQGCNVDGLHLVLRLRMRGA